MELSMWHNKISGQNVVNFHKGFTLIEMLISLSLGTVLLFIFAHFYSDVFYTQTKQRTSLNLQQTTHQLLNYLQQHIQHSGYQGIYREESNYPYFLVKGKSHALVSERCFLFFYDLNQDGCVGSRNKKQQCYINQLNNTKDVKKELFGFKFEKNHLLVFDDKHIDRCYGTACQDWVKSCERNVWRKMTELSDYMVEYVRFKWIVPNKLLSIELSLSANQLTKVSYQATAYSYLLNEME